MYHRFNESKYPSTNIELEIFKEQLKIIENENIQFIDPKNFDENLTQNKKERKILLTIDDGLLSFYKNAWPILKKRKIPFILFVNTSEAGSLNYMIWDHIIELHNRPIYLKYLVNNLKDKNYILYFHNDPLSMSGSKTISERMFLLNNCYRIVFNSNWSKKRFLQKMKSDAVNSEKLLVINQSATKNKINFKNKKKNYYFCWEIK